MPLLSVIAASTGSAGSLSTVVTADMVKGVFDEILSLLPVIIPVSVSFIGIRKGLGFLFGSLRQA